MKRQEDMEPRAHSACYVWNLKCFFIILFPMTYHFHREDSDVLWVFFQMQTNWRTKKWKEVRYGALNALSVSLLKSKKLFLHLVSNVLTLSAFEPSVCFLLDLIQPFLLGFHYLNSWFFGTVLLHLCLCLISFNLYSNSCW